MRDLVLCLSGGLDSSIVGLLLKEDAALYPIFFDYGQAAVVEEWRAATFVVDSLELNSIKRVEVDYDPGFVDACNPYYPQRNLIFASMAQAYACVVGAEAVVFGFVKDTDAEEFPDATEAFSAGLTSFTRLIYGIKSPSVISPAASLFKSELIAFAEQVGFDWNKTYSCFQAGGPCGKCRSCQARDKALVEHSTRTSKNGSCGHNSFLSRAESKLTPIGEVEQRCTMEK